MAAGDTWKLQWKNAEFVDGRIGYFQISNDVTYGTDKQGTGHIPEVPCTEDAVRNGSVGSTGLLHLPGYTVRAVAMPRIAVELPAADVERAA